MSAQTSIFARNVAANAQAALAKNGYMRIYSGKQPVTPESVATGTLLGELRFDEPAFKPASIGELTAYPFVGEKIASSDGKAGWFRILREDGVSAIWDGEVALEGSGIRAEMYLDSIDFSAGASIELSNPVIKLPQS